MLKERGRFSWEDGAERWRIQFQHWLFWVFRCFPVKFFSKFCFLSAVSLNRRRQFELFFTSDFRPDSLPSSSRPSLIYQHAARLLAPPSSPGRPLSFFSYSELNFREKVSRSGGRKVPGLILDFFTPSHQPGTITGTDTTALRQTRWHLGALMYDFASVSWTVLVWLVWHNTKRRSNESELWAPSATNQNRQKELQSSGIYLNLLAYHCLVYQGLHSTS